MSRTDQGPSRAGGGGAVKQDIKIIVSVNRKIRRWDNVKIMMIMMTMMNMMIMMLMVSHLLLKPR